jgi:hypothetical protein
MLLMKLHKIHKNLQLILKYRVSQRNKVIYYNGIFFCMQYNGLYGSQKY